MSIVCVFGKPGVCVITQPGLQLTNIFRIDQSANSFFNQLFDCLFYKSIKFPRAQADFFRLLVLSNKHFKTPKIFSLLLLFLEFSYHRAC